MATALACEAGVNGGHRSILFNIACDSTALQLLAYITALIATTTPAYSYYNPSVSTVDTKYTGSYIRGALLNHIDGHHVTHLAWTPPSTMTTTRA